MTIKKVTWICGFILALGVFCITTAVQSAELKKVSVQLKWFHGFQFAGYYAAVEKGFYAEEGLEVTLKERIPKKSHIRSVLDGDAEYGVADAGLLAERMKGEPVVVLKQIFQYSPLVFLTLKKSGITSPFDLVGKKVMVDSKGLSDAPLLEMMHTTLGNVDQVEIVPHSHSLDELITGKIDAVSAYITNQPFLLHQQGIEFNILNPKNFGIDFYGDNLFTTEQEINSHPDRVKKMIRATLKGWEYALAHPQEIIDLILKKYNPKLHRDQLVHSAKMTDLMIRSEVAPLGTVTIPRYKKIADTYKRAGLAGGRIDLSEFIYGGIRTLSALTATEKAFIDKHPIVLSASEYDYPPFSVVNESGVADGFSVELLRASLKAVGLDVEFSVGPWAKIKKDLEVGIIHALPVVGRTPERGSVFDFTVPYYSSYGAIFVRQGDQRITKRADLLDKQIFVMKGDLAEEFARRTQVSDHIVTTESYEGAFTLLSEGKGDAVIVQEQVGAQLLSKLGIDNIVQIIQIKEFKQDFTFAVTEGNKELLALLNEGLSRVLADGTFDRLHAKWFVLPEERVVTKTATPELVPYSQAGFVIQMLAIVFSLLSISLFVFWLIRGRPKDLSIRETFFMISLVYACLIVTIGILVTLLLDGGKKQTAIENHRFDSYALALELKQSSEDLTRFARTYVSTEDPKYESLFNMISEIRDGLRPHPVTYTPAFWDHIAAGTVDMNSDGETYAIQGRIEELGLSAEESEKLRLAKKLSDDLVNLERVAMNAVKGKFKDADGNFTIRKEPDQSMARSLLYGQRYHDAKSRIMEPIDEFFTLLINRTANDLNGIRARNNALLLGITALICITVGFSVFIFFLLKRRIVFPLHQLEESAIRVGEGERDADIRVERKDEIGQLAEAFNYMLCERNEAEGELILAKEQAEKALADLEEQEKRFRSLVENIPGVVYSCDLDEHWTMNYISDYIEDISGSPASDFLNNKVRSYASLIHPDDTAMVTNNVTKSLDSTGFFTIEYRIIDKHGNIHWVFERGQAIRGKDSKAAHIDGIILDISDRKKNERELELLSERLQLATEAAEVGIWDWNITNNELIWDESMYRLFEVDKEDFSGNYEAWENTVHPEEKDKAALELQRAIEGEEEFNTSFRIVLSGDRIRHIKAEGKVYRDESGEPVRMLGVNYDISETIKAQQAIEQLNKDLESRIDERTVELEKSKKAALSIMQDANQAKKKAEDALVRLKESQAELLKLSRAIEASPVSVMVTDANAVIEYVNPKFSDVTGYSFEEAIGRKPNILKSGELPDTFYKELWDTLTAGLEWHGEICNKKKNGTIFWERAFISSIRNEEGVTIHYVAVKEDITEKKKADEELKQSETNLAQAQRLAHLGSWKLDIVNNNLSWSDEVFRIFEIDPEKFGASYDAFLNTIHPEDREMVNKAYTDSLENKEPYTIEHRLLMDDGRIKYIVEQCNTVFDEQGNPLVSTGSVQDITDRKHIELDLLEAKKSAESATKAKSDFLANMSHEIRTPMNAVIGLSHLVGQTELDIQQKDYLSKISTSAKSLLNIINDILDFSKIEAGKLTIEKIQFNLSEQLEDVVAIFTDRLADKGVELFVTLDAKIPTVLLGDPLRISQIFNNLLSNAAKFTDKGGIIEIKARVLDLQKNTTNLECFVSDTGIGMSPEQAANVFGKFTQADTSTSRQYGGTGLGLAICHQLVDLMGGEIRIESELDHGSKFIFTMPLEHQEDRRKQKSGILPLNLRDLKVLLFDDNTATSSQMARQLQELSFNVEIFTECWEVVSALEETKTTQDPFELMVVDYHNIDKVFSSVCGNIHLSTELSEIPLIIISTVKELPEAKISFDGHEMVSVLAKPVTPSRLFNSIVEAFGCNDLKIQKRRELPRYDTVTKLEEIHGAAILLVEDNKINQEVASELLKYAKAEITIAGNGEEALELVQKQEFDLVLMDIQMPVMDGLTATREIRKLKSSIKDVPIVAMTALAMVGDREKSLAAGMNDHITKPIEPDELYGCLVRWIKPSKTVQRSGVSDQVVDEKQKDTEEQIEFPENIPGIDLDLGLKHLAGNKKLYLNLLEDFKKENENFSDQVLAALEAKETETAKRLAHTLKGVSGSIGASDLQKKALQLETAIKEKSDTVQSVLDETWNDLQILLTEIGRALPAEEEGSVPSLPLEDVDLENIAEKLAGLRKLLEVSDMEAETVFQEIKDDLFSLYPEQASQLAKAIESFDFKQALKVLNDLEF